MSVASDDAPKAPAKSASTAKKRGLGRGLEALLGPKAAAEAPSLEANGNDTLRNLPVDALTAGKYQPRKHWDEDKLEELAESIKAQGVISRSWCAKSTALAVAARPTKSSPANAAGVPASWPG